MCQRRHQRPRPLPHQVVNQRPARQLRRHLHLGLHLRMLLWDRQVVLTILRGNQRRRPKTKTTRSVRGHVSVRHQNVSDLALGADRLPVEEDLLPVEDDLLPVVAGRPHVEIEDHLRGITTAEAMAEAMAEAKTEAKAEAETEVEMTVRERTIGRSLARRRRNYNSLVKWIHRRRRKKLVLRSSDIRVLRETTGQLG